MFDYCRFTNREFLDRNYYLQEETHAKENQLLHPILNMAMSDILISIFIIPVDFVELLVKLSRTMCKVAPIVKYLSCVVSVESLVLIAVDRFGVVVFPLRLPFISSTYKICRFLILATWISGVVVVSPYLTSFPTP